MSTRPTSHCSTWHYLRMPVPPDLITWEQAEAVIAASPHPMSARNLRRKYLAAGRRVYHLHGVRGERVSRSDVCEFHRDYWNGWSRIKPPAGGRRGRRPTAVP